MTRCPGLDTGHDLYPESDQPLDGFRTRSAFVPNFVVTRLVASGVMAHAASRIRISVTDRLG